jgi:HAD superfamily hydrolase (TIGR01509 family)
MRATLFDFNGVLVDDENVHLEAFREALAPRGIVITDADYAERYLGFDDVGAFRAMLNDAGHEASDAAIAELIAAKSPAYFRRIETALRIFPGAADLVRRRADVGLVGIVSGALRPEIEHALGKMGVAERVSFIVSAEDTKACKPDPEGFVAGLARVPAGSSVVVLEDSLAGVQAAKAAGLRCVAVTHSYPREALRGAGADLVVDALTALDDAAFDGGVP